MTDEEELKEYAMEWVIRGQASTPLDLSWAILFVENWTSYGKNTLSAKRNEWKQIMSIEQWEIMFDRLQIYFPDYDIVAIFTSSFVSGYYFPHYIDDLIKDFVILAAEQGYGYTTPVSKTSFVILLPLNALMLCAILLRRKKVIKFQYPKCDKNE